MKLTRGKILETLASALLEAQQDVTDSPEEITESTRPIGDLQGFDSLASVGVTLHCLIDLGFEKLPSFPSLFIGKQNNALTVGEVADRILAFSKKLE